VKASRKTLASPRFKWAFLHPRYWGIWFIFGLLWLIIQLPYRQQLKFGRAIGRLAAKFSKKRRWKIAAINIALCFPELSNSAQHDLVQQHFETLGITLVETALAWWGTDKQLQNLAHVSGIEHLEKALKKGKGAILFSGHYTSLELGLRFLAPHCQFSFAYRHHENPLINYIILKSRMNHVKRAIRRDDIRSMIRSLRENKAVWFAPDQNSGGKQNLFAPFFNVPAATSTATVRLANLTETAIVPFVSHRLANGKGYQISLLPSLENFPTDDLAEDVARLNKVIETAVRLAPDQYLWVHRRFKDRPDDEPRFY